MPTNSAKSKRVWKHNSFFGHVRMDLEHMKAIMYAQTTNTKAKQLAVEISQLLVKLSNELKDRIDDAHP